MRSYLKGIAKAGIGRGFGAIRAGLESEGEGNLRFRIPRSVKGNLGGQAGNTGGFEKVSKFRVFKGFLGFLGNIGNRKIDFFRT
jgi:hypothetical protein